MTLEEIAPLTGPDNRTADAGHIRRRAIGASTSRHVRPRP